MEITILESYPATTKNIKTLDEKIQENVIMLTYAQCYESIKKCRKKIRQLKKEGYLYFYKREKKYSFDLDKVIVRIFLSKIPRSEFFIERRK